MIVSLLVRSETSPEIDLFYIDLTKVKDATFLKILNKAVSDYKQNGKADIEYMDIYGYLDNEANAEVSPPCMVEADIRVWED
jgi:hypothetical protein